MIRSILRKSGAKISAKILAMVLVNKVLTKYWKALLIKFVVRRMASFLSAVMLVVHVGSPSAPLRLLSTPKALAKPNPTVQAMYRYKVTNWLAYRKSTRFTSTTLALSNSSSLRTNELSDNKRTINSTKAPDQAIRLPI